MVLARLVLARLVSLVRFGKVGSGNVSLGWVRLDCLFSPSKYVQVLLILGLFEKKVGVVWQFAVY